MSANLKQVHDEMTAYRYNPSTRDASLLDDVDSLEVRLITAALCKYYAKHRPYNFLTWLWGIGVSLDQLANAVCGGNPDMTISARIGQFAPHSRYWRALEALVDWAFLPIQGPWHCQKALAEEWGRRDRPGNKAAQAALGLLLYVLMPPFGVAGRVWKLSKGTKHEASRTGL